MLPRKVGTRENAPTFSGSCLKQATPRERTDRVLAALQTARYRSSMHLGGRRTAPDGSRPGRAEPARGREPGNRYREGRASEQPQPVSSAERHHPPGRPPRRSARPGHSRAQQRLPGAEAAQLLRGRHPSGARPRRRSPPPPPGLPRLTVSTATKVAVRSASTMEGHSSVKLSFCTSTTGTRHRAMAAAAATAAAPRRSRGLCRRGCPPAARSPRSLFPPHAPRSLPAREVRFASAASGFVFPFSKSRCPQNVGG